MKLYHSIKICSKFLIPQELIKQKLYFSIQNQTSKISSSDDKPTSGEFFVSKLLDSLKIPYKNQFTCLLIRCSFCNNTSLYINKITGKYFYNKF